MKYLLIYNISAGLPHKQNIRQILKKRSRLYIIFNVYPVPVFIVSFGRQRLTPFAG